MDGGMEGWRGGGEPGILYNSPTHPGHLETSCTWKEGMKEKGQEEEQ